MTQHYVGTKIVTAWPAEKNGQPGYGVKYADGYTSWSPAEVFEEAYLPLGHIGHLAPHQQRLVGERAELCVRIDRLTAFLFGGAAINILAEERELLVTQLHHMKAYAKILGRRCRSIGMED